MATYFYRFENEQAFVDACNVPVEGSELNEFVLPPDANVIGVIITTVNDEPVTLPGYHVNLPYEHEPWWPYQVNPAQPVRVFWES